MQPVPKIWDDSQGESLRTNCLNCGNSFHPGEYYCPQCGQLARTRRITNRQLIRDFFTSIIKADRGLLRLMIGLTIQPGRTASEYVEGKRKKYFNPFGFLALCIGFMLFLSNWIDPYIDLTTPNPKMLSLITDDEIRYKYLLMLERMAWSESFVNNNLNFISILITPYFAVLLWMFFRRRGRNMAEIFVAYIFFTGFANVVSALIIYPLLKVSQSNLLAYNIILNSNMLLQTVYFAWGFNGFFGYSSPRGFLKVLGALLLIGLIGLVIVFTAYFFYIVQGDFRLIPYMARD